ncbi:Uncharacterised protein [Bordetella ansorpii]|uniref:Type III secretion protein n=1 Tax=Bordetella ansorpii TaxID=288768 RepID=A0A157NWM5_9BORD|nr:hypothetical protein [Bordetella ansorpii]SAI25414.1 Uncharacterised protein [Bordetella ansorpii]
MSVDRRIDLHTSVAQQDLSDLAQSDTGLRRNASDADRQAFERALAQPQDESADDADRKASPQQAADAMPRPFGLFATGLPSQMPADAAAAGSDIAAALGRDLAEAADRLLVGDGSSGRREVRVELKDDVLPGVTVSVYQEAGRVVAAFACASEASREKLCAAAPGLAAELARSLGRACLVRVTTDDPEDPCLFEIASGDPSDGGAPSSADAAP